MGALCLHGNVEEVKQSSSRRAREEGGGASSSFIYLWQVKVTEYLQRQQRMMGIKQGTVRICITMLDFLQGQNKREAYLCP